MARIALPALLVFLFLPHAVDATELVSAGGGEFVFERTAPCLTGEMRAEIQQYIDANVAMLEREGKLLEYSSRVTLFEWPLQAVPSYPHYGYHGVSGFVDHDTGPGILDYYCGSSTYDGHAGFDPFLWPFSWNMMADEVVQVVSAARGVIVGKYDGYQDQSCDWVNPPPWNAVYVQHPDQSVVWYGHMKTNSTTAKSIGDTVEVGEYLGLVGSSGMSTGPHLHFEVHKRFGLLIDPFYDACNSLNGATWWVDQRPYYDSAINALMTHSAPPQWTDCPDPTITNESNIFMPGDPLVTAIYLRDELLGQVTDLKIYRPDDSVWQSFSHTMGATHYQASWWYWNWTLPIDAPEGLWKFEAVYLGDTYEHIFVVGDATSVADAAPAAGAARLEQSVPNPFNPTATITYNLPEKSNVTIEIFSVGGGLVKRLVDAAAEAGRNEVVWNGLNDRGQEASSGVYFVRLAAGKATDMKKISLIR